MARRKYLGNVNLLGLNQFGQNPGLNPIFGALIGGGVAKTTQLLLADRKGALQSNGFGLLAGLAISGGMYAMKSTRHAAVAGAVGAFLATGISWLKEMFTEMGKSSVAGMGITTLRTLNGFGIPAARELRGFGIPMASNVTAPVGVAGSHMSAPGLGGPPVSLMGAQSPQAAHLRGMGGPAVHGLSTAYGATLLGGGR